MSHGLEQPPYRSSSIPETFDVRLALSYNPPPAPATTSFTPHHLLLVQLLHHLSCYFLLFWTYLPVFSELINVLRLDDLNCLLNYFSIFLSLKLILSSYNIQRWGWALRSSQSRAMLAYCRYS